MASLGANTELEKTASGKLQRTSLIFNLDGKEDFSICSLTTGKTEQQVLDLILTEGETVAFRVDGPNAVHLSGYYINEEEENGFINDSEDDDEIFSDEAEEDSQIEYDSEFDSEDSEFDSEDSEFDSEEKETKNPRIRVLESDENEEDEMDSEEESDSQEAVSKSSKKVKFDITEAKKTKEVVATPAAKESPKESPKAAVTKVTPPVAKSSPAQVQASAVKPASPQSASKEQIAAPVKKTLPSGLQIEDLKLGSGAKVSQGKKVLIHYKGTLQNGQVFDSSFGGKPLKFAVGKGEVIKGMDMGIIGMAMGGSRKLVIPGPLAYGNQSLPKIPRNSTLVFEIRLEKIL